MTLFSAVDDRSGVVYQEYRCVDGEDVVAGLHFLFNAVAPKDSVTPSPPLVQRRSLGAAIPSDAGELGALEHQCIDRHQDRASRHGEGRNLGADQEWIEDACRRREGDDVVADRPLQILVHLVQRGTGELNRADDVKWIALHQHHISALDRNSISRAVRQYFDTQALSPSRFN